MYVLTNINTWQAMLTRNLLRTEVFLHLKVWTNERRQCDTCNQCAELTDSERVVRSTLDCGIVDHYHTFPSRYSPYASYDAGSRHVVGIDVVCSQLR